MKGLKHSITANDLGKFIFDKLTHNTFVKQVPTSSN